MWVTKPIGVDRGSTKPPWRKTLEEIGDHLKYGFRGVLALVSPPVCLSFSIDLALPTLEDPS